MENATKNIAYMAGVVLLVLGLSVYISTQVTVSKYKNLPYYSFDFETNEVLTTSQPEHTVGSFSFSNQEGKTITQEEVGKTIYVADFFFAQCPGICREMSSQLQKVYMEFENQPRVKILSLTSKPEEDSVTALMNYAIMNKVKDHKKWLFLTGNKKALYKMAREQYFIVNEKGDGGKDDFIHTEYMVLIDQNKHIRGYYDGTDPADMKLLIEDIRQLIDNMNDKFSQN